MGTDSAHGSSLINFTGVDISRHFKSRAEVRMVDTRNNGNGFVL
jgi:hypothetical protein